MDLHRQLRSLVEHHLTGGGVFTYSCFESESLIPRVNSASVIKNGRNELWKNMPDFASFSFLALT